MWTIHYAMGRKVPRRGVLQSDGVEGKRGKGWEEGRRGGLLMGTEVSGR